MAVLTLREFQESYSISRLGAHVPIPEWADGPGFVTVSRTSDELSIVCLSDRVPDGVKSDGPWSCFQLIGPFDLTLTGIAVRIVTPVSNAGIGFLFVTTFDTDYLLVKQAQNILARSVLMDAGFLFAE
jgi:uncharacterized protein